jgi:hypothetical protein
LLGAAAVWAQPSTTPPPTPPSTSPPSQPGGRSGTGIGIQIDLDTLFREKKKTPVALVTHANAHVIGSGSSLGGAARGVTPAPKTEGEMEQKTAVYHGMIVEGGALGPCIEREQDKLARIAQDVQRQIAASGRFEVMGLPAGTGDKPGEFVKGVGAALEGHAEDMARAREEAKGENYDFKYKGTIVSGAAIDQVIGNTYGYEIAVGPPQVQALQTPQGTRYIATIPVTVTFYKINSQGQPSVQRVVQGQIGAAVAGAGADPCDAVSNALNGGFAITDQIQAIPEFRAQGDVIEVLNGGRTLTMRPGAHEGVKAGDRYDIVQQMSDGTSRVVGHAVVETVGTGLVAAGMGASKADVTENRTHLRITDLDPGFNRGNLGGATLVHRPG